MSVERTWMQIFQQLNLQAGKPVSRLLLCKCAHELEQNRCRAEDHVRLIILTMNSEQHLRNSAPELGSREAGRRAHARSQLAMPCQAQATPLPRRSDFPGFGTVQV